MAEEYRHFAHGIGIVSGLALPEFHGLSEDTPQSVVISECEDLPLLESSAEAYWTDKTGFHISWKQVGAFQINHSGNIRFRRVPSASDDLVRVPLLGVVLAVALHYRQVLVMHGNAMFINSVGIILVGEKGQGKSTLSAAMVNRGHHVYADDAASVALAGEAPAEVLAGAQQLRLWRDSMSQTLGEGNFSYRHIHELGEKLVVSLPIPADGPLRLPFKRLYIIEDAPTIAFQPLSAAEAWQHVLAHTMVARFGSDFLVGTGATWHFAACLSLAKQVRCVRLLRPRDFSRLAEVVTHIETDLLSA